ncbi:MAG: hypothetical protein ACM3U1_08810 [Chloroflexota bacterium]
MSKKINVLVICIVLAAAFAALMGIFTNAGGGEFDYLSIRGEAVKIFGKGVYRHMSADVAPQGIAQDYVTLFLAAPLALIALYFANKGSSRARLALTGVVGYFLVTYNFYLPMAAYNELFLVYAFLLGTSFFAFTLLMLSFYREIVKDGEVFAARFSSKASTGAGGRFLIFNAIAISLLWLGVVVPPLLDGTIVPKAAQHYTTLIVQGFDLGMGLPLSFVAGWGLLKRRSWGYLLGSVYLIFLSLLMTALVAKIIAMALLGANLVPVVFIIPLFAFASVYLGIRMLRAFK